MERSTRKSIQFLHPFCLSEAEGMQPAGTYEVETIEHQIEGVSFIAYRRHSTTITLQHPTSRADQVTTIDPVELAAALEMDAVPTGGAVRSMLS